MIVVAGYAIGSLFTLAAVANVCMARQPKRLLTRNRTR
jgi:hypothetical protein